jgi:hypothetical protein
MARSFENALEDHLRRFHEPDGCCIHCGQPADRHRPVGPIRIVISTPGDDEIRGHEFCEWRCLAHWIARQSGGDFVEMQQ